MEQLAQTRFSEMPALVAIITFDVHALVAAWQASARSLDSDPKMNWVVLASSLFIMLYGIFCQFFIIVVACEIFMKCLT